jgi:hypothetical protein
MQTEHSKCDVPRLSTSETTEILEPMCDSRGQKALIPARDFFRNGPENGYKERDSLFNRIPSRWARCLRVSRQGELDKVFFLVIR